MSEGIDIDRIIARTAALRDALNSAAPLLDAIVATVAAHAGDGAPVGVTAWIGQAACLAAAARGLAQRTGDAVVHDETKTGDSQ